MQDKDIHNNQFEKINPSEFNERILSFQNQAEQRQLNNASEIIESENIKETKETHLPFPVNIFPENLRYIIEQCSSCFQTPIDYWASAILSACSLAIGNKITVKWKYENSPILWMCLVGHSGTGKTQPLNFAFKPFFDRDLIELDKYKIDLAEYERMNNLSKAEKEQEHISCLPPMPQYKQFIISDATPESIIATNEINKSGICLLRDELRGFFMDFGRYSKSGEQTTWLSSFMSQPISINRVSKIPRLLNRPFINLIGGVQPAILSELAKDHRDEDGFLPRMLFAFPVTNERPLFSSTTLHTALTEAYSVFIDKLIKQEHRIIELSNEAKSVFEEYYNKIAIYSNAEKTEYIKAVYAKMDIYSLRFALILHCIEDCEGSKSSMITEHQMKASVSLCEYFRLNAVRVHNIICASGSGQLLVLKNVIKWVKQVQNPKASQRDISNAMGCAVSYVNKVLLKQAGEQ